MQEKLRDQVIYQCDRQAVALAHDNDDDDDDDWQVTDV